MTPKIAWARREGQGGAWDHIDLAGETFASGGFQIAAPLTKDLTGWNVTLLPRLTLRSIEAADRTSGAGNAGLFALFIVNERKRGRWGIGPPISLPAEAASFGTTDWRYGFAAAFRLNVSYTIPVGK